MGKGDTRRKSQVPEEEVQINWDRIFNKREGKMSKQYIYEASEQTVDVRSWTIKSDRQLTEDEVTDIYQDSQIENVGEEQEYSTGITVTFEGTEYGDDAIPDIQGDFKEE
tara:strand:+ start:950 stop:1279 length:330 start_codon:yes stop_codon:yes gene_type:complete